MRVFAWLILVPAVCLGQQKTCSADGSVFNSVTGEPVPRARVAVLNSRSGVVADGTGRWNVADLPCGPMRLSASKPGFLPGPVTTTNAPAQDIRIELIPQAVVTGKVLDEAGDPVPNARVTVLLSLVVEGRRSFVQGSVANTNDLGEYRIASLPAGKIFVCSSAPPDGPSFDSGDTTILGESCYPGPVEGGSAGALSLSPGREARVDFNLTRVPTVHIRGKLTGLPEGMGAAVTLVRPGLISQSKVATMARDGSFEVRGVPPGWWTLSVDYWENGKRLLARMPLEAGASDIDNVVLHVDSGVTLTGTVPALPKQVNVSLRGAERMLGAGAPQWDKTRTTFTIGDAIPGSYMLSVNVPPPYYVKSAMLGGRDMSVEAVPILQSSGPVQVVIGDDGGSVQGQIQDADGDPAQGWVMLWREGRAPIQMPATPEGRFKMAGLAPGDYTVYAWDDIQQVEYADPEWMRRNGGQGLAVTVMAGQTADVKLTRAMAPQE